MTRKLKKKRSEENVIRIFHSVIIEKQAVRSKYLTQTKELITYLTFKYHKTNMNIGGVHVKTEN